MSSVLFVPIHLDALVLSHDRSVVDATTDFRRLPYFDGNRDVNTNTAYISEEVVSQPFQNQNLHLAAGIHLHWALPDALTKGTQTNGHTSFPAVPNRWLVTRSQNQRDEPGEARWTVKKQWIVESDYIYPEGEGESAGAVAIPQTIDAANGRYHPYRYLARAMTLDVWREKEEKNELAEYWPDLMSEPLTAVGHGEVTFAAFYPNCHSVFGLYDDDPDVLAGGSPDDLRYDVIGWYSDANQDILQMMLESAESSNEVSDGLAAATLLAVLQDELQWTFTSEEGDPDPEQTVFFAQLTFTPGDDVDNLAMAEAETTVAVGNTGTEALSAYLAQTIEPAYKGILEDQLEALQLAGRLEHRQLDIGAKFREARHEKAFSAVAAGTVWAVTQEGSVAAASATTTSGQTQVTLPEDIAHDLNHVNILQTSYDAALQEIESMREQLFADWYKYMICAYPPDHARDDYPDIDEVKYFIEQQCLAPLHAKVLATGTLLLATDATTGNVSAASADASSASTAIAGQLADAINGLLSAVAEYNSTPEVVNANAVYVLRTQTADWYWQPNEPVLLLTGDAATASLRHGKDGRLNDDDLLDCTPLALADTIPNSFAELRTKISELAPDDPADAIAYSTWTQQPWNPIFLEWEVAVNPLGNLSNLASESGDYDAEFVNDNYTLAENAPDLAVQSEKAEVMVAASLYSGCSLLTDYACSHLTAYIEDYLTAAGYLVDGTLQPYEPSAMTAEEPAQDPVYTVWRAYEQLQELPVLSQALSGFNDALLQHRQTLQIRIDEPLGFAAYRAFTDDVRHGVNTYNRRAPEPLNDFMPIRSGVMKINRLRLVDSFGQVKELDIGDVMTTEQMTTGTDNAVALAPRLVQPARLDFRWLAADNGAMEMNSHPATTPVCGWLMPNNLDDSLLVYDKDGVLLGTINQRSAWVPPPGHEQPLAIHNDYLARVVAYLTDDARDQDEHEDFIGNFIAVLDSALENSDPENFAQHQDLALLMGRPIAVVRASLNLEVQGMVAINQSWNAFRHDMNRTTRERDDFTHVRLPFRLGEYAQFNDGLIGYWREGADGLTETFYAPQSNEIDHAGIQTHADYPDGSLVMQQALDDAPQTFTLLVDPRGVVHATTGITPVKGLRIPPDQYVDALQAIEVTFLSTPILTDLILTDEDTINLPLPNETGYSWSWVDAAGHDRAIGTPTIEATFAATQEIREGWLKLGVTENSERINA